MIQRIQSLWLLLATVALAAVLFLPVGKFVMPHGYYECTAFKMTLAGDVMPMQLPVWLIAPTAILAALVSFVSIFLYRNRNFQIRVTWVALLVNLILFLSLSGLFLYFKYAQDSWVGYGPAALMPILGIVLNFLAIKGIQKDEALVKSLDRIR